jgi:hypothetical protein
VLSCFYEAVRLYRKLITGLEKHAAETKHAAPAYVTIREATEDTVWTYPSITHPGTDEQLLVPRGCHVALDLIGASMCTSPFQVLYHPSPYLICRSKPSSLPRCRQVQAVPLGPIYRFPLGLFPGPPFLSGSEVCDYRSHLFFEPLAAGLESGDSPQGGGNR